MLVITRKLGEKIQIGNATITVTRTGQCNVSIGVDAPDDVRIQRVGATSPKQGAILQNAIVKSVPDDKLSKAS